MKKRVTIAITIIIAVAVISVIFGFTRKAKSEEQVTITIAWWGGEARHELFNKLFDKYEAEHPNVKIERQYSSFNDYWTKFQTQAASGSLPDIYGMVAMQKGEYADRDIMENLTPYVESGVINIDDFTEGSINSGVIGNDLYMLSMGDTVACLLVNKTLIENAGMEPPTGELTWSELLDYMRELKPLLPEGCYCFGKYYFEQYFEQFARNYGYEIVNEEGNGPGYDKETLTEFYTIYKTILDEGLGMPADVAAEDYPKQYADDLSGEGRIAFLLGNANHITTYQNVVGDDYEIAVIRHPIADNATHKYVEMTQPSAWCIATTSEHKDLCAEIINYTANDLEFNKTFNMEWGVPGSIAVQDMLLENLTDSKMDQGRKNQIELVRTVLETNEAVPMRKEGTTVLLDDILKRWDDIMFGTTTIEEAVNAHFEQATALLY